MTLLNSMME